ncbi:MAG: hypothetical protein M5U28_10005 [Sandaracinaceae bacterium]|nr:hypothetical protein [Sandaracinaceae bacterium]
MRAERELAVEPLHLLGVERPDVVASSATKSAGPAVKLAQGELRAVPEGELGRRSRHSSA